jgi:hypothetical protein
LPLIVRHIEYAMHGHVASGRNVEGGGAHTRESTAALFSATFPVGRATRS